MCSVGLLARSGFAFAGESELLWQDPRDKWLKLIHQHCSGVKHPFVLLKGDIERPWRLLCSKVREAAPLPLCVMHGGVSFSHPPR